MSTTSKIVAALVVTLAIIGAYFYPGQSIQPVGSSAAGSSYGTSRIASQSVTAATTTTFALLNTDANDRTIRAAEVYLANAVSTTTTFAIKCATSTSASQITSANYILNTQLSATIYGTTTGSGLYIASTSPGVTGTTTTSVVSQQFANPFARNWASGSYLVCQVTTGDGYNALNSGTTGTVTFPYLAQ